MSPNEYVNMLIFEGEQNLAALGRRAPDRGVCVCTGVFIYMGGILFRSLLNMIWRIVFFEFFI